MTVVTFQEYQPLARYDGSPWTKVNIMESASPTGPWANIQTITFIDPDIDPTNPKVRSFTTENAILTEGWYQLIFEDATGDTSPTEPVHNVHDPTEAYQPLVSDIGRLLMARTRDTLGNELGTFTTATRPNFLQVADLINHAAQFVRSSVDSDIPEGAYTAASAVIALRAAMMVELSYFPEQVNSPRSPYTQLKELYDQEMKILVLAVERERGEEAGGDETTTALSPEWSFPPNAGGLVGWRTNW